MSRAKHFLSRLVLSLEQVCLKGKTDIHVLLLLNAAGVSAYHCLQVGFFICSGLDSLFQRAVTQLLLT